MNTWRHAVLSGRAAPRGLGQAGAVASPAPTEDVVRQLCSIAADYADARKRGKDDSAATWRGMFDMTAESRAPWVVRRALLDELAAFPECKVPEQYLRELGGGTEPLSGALRPVRIDRAALASLLGAVSANRALGQTARELREKQRECASKRELHKALYSGDPVPGTIGAARSLKILARCDAEFRAMVLRRARQDANIFPVYPEFGTAPFADAAPAPDMPPIGAFPGAMTAYVPPTAGVPPVMPPTLPPRAPGFRMTPTMVPSGFEPSGPVGPGTTPPPTPPPAPSPYKSAPPWVETGYAKAPAGTAPLRFPLPFNVFGGAGGVPAGGFM
jgi:hypothetical protein